MKLNAFTFIRLIFKIIISSESNRNFFIIHIYVPKKFKLVFLMCIIFINRNSELNDKINSILCEF